MNRNSRADWPETGPPVTVGPCPYLDAAPPWRVRSFEADVLDPAEYERLLAYGFRRNGHTFYKPDCDGCARCIPIRIDAEAYVPTRSQRRVARRNADVTVTSCACEETHERFDLYRRYLERQHDEPSADGPLEQYLYANFLVATPFDAVTVVDYWIPGSSGGVMVANGYLDALPEGLSSIYFVWDPEYARRSLGVFSINEEIRLCRKTGRRWYYLGYWVPGSEKMDYKADHGPAEIALDGAWVPLDDNARTRLREESR